jgi:transposase
MLPRHAISDADWESIKDLLPRRPGLSGWTAKDNRLFLDAVLWIAKTGAPWRDLPEASANGTRCGNALIVGAERGRGNKFFRHWATLTWSG